MTINANRNTAQSYFMWKGMFLQKKNPGTWAGLFDSSPTYNLVLSLLLPEADSTVGKLYCLYSITRFCYGEWLSAKRERGIERRTGSCFNQARIHRTKITAVIAFNWS